jgi:hypothetical protein
MSYDYVILLMLALCPASFALHLFTLILDQFFMEPSDFYGALINKVLYFIRSVGLIKG